jgi:ABC-2 type transport system ATP-binding protein
LKGVVSDRWGQIMVPAIEVNDLWKYFGAKPALKGVHLTVEEGVVFGIIGPNGAGKTTLFRILATILKPSRGAVKIFGHDIIKEAGVVRDLISYLPEDAGVYKHLTGHDYLRMVASLYGRGSVERGKEVSGLGDRLKERAGTYSKGMKRRLLLAGCLMTSPKLAILDEPTAGLDVEHAVYVRKLIREYAAKGTTVLVSSHNMLEVNYLCDEIAILHNGILLERGTPRGLLSKYSVSNLEELFMKKVSEA